MKEKESYLYGSVKAKNIVVNGRERQFSYNDVYVIVRPSAIFISDWANFRYAACFEFDEIHGFEITEENGNTKKLKTRKKAQPKWFKALHEQ